MVKIISQLQNFYNHKIDSSPKLLYHQMSQGVDIMFPVNNWMIFKQQCAKAERKIVRKSGNWIGGTLLVSYLVSFVLQLVLAFALIETGNAALLNDSMFSLYLQIGFSILMFVPPFIILATVTKFRFRDLVAHKKIPLDHGFWFVCIGVALCFGANYVTNIWVTLLQSLGANLDYGSLTVPDSVIGKVLWVFTASVLPAIIEEFAFRVVVLGSLRRYSDTFAIFASALLFGLIHGNAIQIPFAFMLGLVFAYITIITGSVIPAIIIHFINNFNSCILELFSTAYGEIYASLFQVLLMIIYVVLGIIGFLLMYKKGYLKKKLFMPKSANSASGALAAFFSSPLIIIVSVLYLLSALLLLVPTASAL